MFGSIGLHLKFNHLWLSVFGLILLLLLMVVGFIQWGKMMDYYVYRWQIIKLGCISETLTQHGDMSTLQLYLLL